MLTVIRTAAVVGLTLLLLEAQNARSELVTFQFQGTVTRTSIDVPEFVGTPTVNWPQVGSSISGFYTFDSAASDGAGSAEQGAYYTVLENGPAVSVSVGELQLEGAASSVATYASIYQAGDWIPSIELVSPPADAAIFNHNNLQLSIRKDGLLPGPILSLSPPSILGAQEAILSLWLDSNLNTSPMPYVAIEASLDSLALAPKLAGDYNGDGMVDSADYVAWRMNDGTPAGFDTWRANFGRTAAASLASVLVPEPASALLLLLGGIVAGLRQRGRMKKPATKGRFDTTLPADLVSRHVGAHD